MASVQKTSRGDDGAGRLRWLKTSRERNGVREEGGGPPLSLLSASLSGRVGVAGLGCGLSGPSMGACTPGGIGRKPQHCRRSIQSSLKYKDSGEETLDI